MADDSDDRAREDIAFIRRAVEQGRGYAGACGLDMLIWGVAIAAGYLGTYARVKGWWQIQPNLLWTVCVILPWLYSLRGLLRRVVSGAPPRANRARQSRKHSRCCGSAAVFSSRHSRSR